MGILKIICLTLLVILGLERAQASTLSYQDEFLAIMHYEDGKSYMDKGIYNKALSSFQISLVHQPNKYLSEAMAAISCRSLYLYASAIYYFRKAIESSGGYAQAYANLGAVYAELGYDKDAFKNLNKAIEEKPGYAYPYNNIGGILLRYGKYDEAVISLRKAIEYAPKIPDAYYNIGTAHYESNSPDSAIYYYDKSIEVNPHFFKAYLAKANVLKSIDRPKEEYAHLCIKAIEAYSKVIGKNNNSYDSYLMRANAYKLLDENVDAGKDAVLKLEKLNRFIDLYPDSYVFIRDRAYTYLDMGNKDAAIADFKTVLKINPEYKKVRAKLESIIKE